MISDEQNGIGILKWTYGVLPFNKLVLVSTAKKKEWMLTQNQRQTTHWKKIEQHKKDSEFAVVIVVQMGKNS